MARFDKFIALAKRLIDKNGEAVSLIRTVRTENATEPWRPGTPTTTTTSIRGVFLNHEAAREVGQILKEGEQIIFMPASDLGTVVPDPATDIVQRSNGEKWTIVSRRSLQPNEQRIMETLTVKQ